MRTFYFILFLFCINISFGEITVYPAKNVDPNAITNVSNIGSISLVNPSKTLKLGKIKGIKASTGMTITDEGGTNLVFVSTAAGGGDVYLANNQEFLGTNTFSALVTGTGIAALTNGFVTEAITNGTASLAVLASGLSGLTNYVDLGTQGVWSVSQYPLAITNNYDGTLTLNGILIATNQVSSVLGSFTNVEVNGVFSGSGSAALTNGFIQAFATNNLASLATLASVANGLTNYTDLGTQGVWNISQYPLAITNGHNAPITINANIISSNQISSVAGIFTNATINGVFSGAGTEALTNGVQNWVVNKGYASNALTNNYNGTITFPSNLIYGVSTVVSESVGTNNLDFNQSPYAIICLTNNIVFAPVNAAAGKGLSILIAGDTNNMANRTITFPSEWKSLLGSNSFTLVSNKIAQASIFYYGTSPTNAVLGWSVQP